MTDCPFCDFQGCFSQELAFHLANQHSQHLAMGDWHASIVCWCGQGPLGVYASPFDVLSQFAVHLQRHGGATAHWLEHSLGLAAKP